METYEPLSLFAPDEVEAESETMEWKLVWNEDGLKTLAAFANSRGGTLRIGVQDNGHIVG
jgi:ATP-dependent DNA helicase RecG